MPFSRTSAAAATSTHARTQSHGMPSAAYVTLRKVVVRQQRDIWRFFSAAQLRCVARGGNALFEHVFRSWNVAQHIALLALFNVAGGGIGSREGPSHCDYWL